MAFVQATIVSVCTWLPMFFVATRVFGLDRRFAALPKLPLELRFYDADEEFPAEAKVLYDLTAPNFLDLECLAALAHILVLELERAARNL